MKKSELSKLALPYSNEDAEKIKLKLHKGLQGFNKKIIVLDDDPTGVQTVHGIKVYTGWNREQMVHCFRDNQKMFFITTNSRSFSRERTKQVHEDIAENILYASKETGQDFIIISRGDSTLRGHYPLETETLKNALEKHIQIDGEIIIPFFGEGNRYTAGNIHYLLKDDELVPVAMTDYAKDPTFGFVNSSLDYWIQEKTNGEYKAEDVGCITLEMLRENREEEISEMLINLNCFDKIIVNAIDYSDLERFTTILLRVIDRGKNYLFRTAASFPKVIGGVEDKGLLKPSELVADNENGGLIVVGSHVKKTSQQLERLRELSNIEFIEFDQHLVVKPEAFDKEILRVAAACEEKIGNGTTCVVYTRRERLDGGGTKEQELEIAVKISNGVSSIIKNIQVTPRFLITKGGITSSEIASIGLGVKEALVLGQIRLGIPVLRIMTARKFKELPYIVFPGNVGNDDDLKEIVKELCCYKN